MKKSTFLFLLIFISFTNLKAQCDAPNLSTTSPLPVDNSGNTSNIVPLFNSEYAIVTGFIIGDNYTIADDINGFITIRNSSDNSVIVSGYSSVTFTATTNEVEVHFFTTDACDGTFSFTVITGTNESTLSIDNEFIVDFKLYPNPTYDFIKIESPFLINELFIYDSLGKEIIKSQPKSFKFEIDISNINSGIYFVKGITKDNNEFIIDRIIKM